MTPESARRELLFLFATGGSSHLTRLNQSPCGALGAGDGQLTAVLALRQSCPCDAKAQTTEQAETTWMFQQPTSPSSASTDSDSDGVMLAQGRSRAPPTPAKCTQGAHSDARPCGLKVTRTCWQQKSHPQRAPGRAFLSGDLEGTPC